MLWYVLLIPAFLFQSIILCASCSALATNLRHLQSDFFEASLVMIVALI